MLQDSRVSRSCFLLHVIPPPFLILQFLSVHLLFTIKIKHQKIPPSQADDSVTLGDINPADEEAENNTTRAQERRSILYILQPLLFHINFVVLLHLSVLSD